MMAGEAVTSAFSPNPCQEVNPPPVKKKRNLPGTPDPDAEVIALSPKSLLATNRFLCEICGKGFQRDQNLQLHRRGHNLPWKLRQRSGKEPRKRVYVCPERSCVHHHPSRALGDLTGIKKHFCRKHGEKKWKCDKCSKRYAVQSDWKAHSKTCGTREYRCDCGTLFSRRDSFITHRAFCDALAEEAARISAASNISTLTSATSNNSNHHLGPLMRPPDMLQQVPSIFKPNGEVDQGNPGLSLWMGQGMVQCSEAMSSTSAITADSMHQSIFGGDPQQQQQLDYQLGLIYGNRVPFFGSAAGELISTSNHIKEVCNPNSLLLTVPSLYSSHQQQQQQQQAQRRPDMSATALLQKAAQIGVTSSATVDPSSTFIGSYSSLRCGSNVPQVEEVPALLFGGQSTSCMATTSLENSAGDHLSALNQMEMFSAGHRLGFEKDGRRDGGQTRDFLGVGVQTLCPPPPSIHGWV